MGLLGRFTVDGLLTVVAGFVLYTLFGFGRGVVTAGRVEVDGLLTVVAGFVLYTLFGFGRGVVTAGRVEVDGRGVVTDGRGAGVPGRFTVVLF